MRPFLLGLRVDMITTKAYTLPVTPSVVTVIRTLKEYQIAKWPSQLGGGLSTIHCWNFSSSIRLAESECILLRSVKGAFDLLTLIRAAALACSNRHAITLYASHV